MTSLVFVAVDWADADALRAGAELGPRTGCAPTEELARHLGPDAAGEEVEYAALHQAGGPAPVGGPRRLVLAVDVKPTQLTGTGDGWGGMTVAGLRWNQVSALFADEPGAAGADDGDLLWFAPQELDQLRPV
jgi:hypothetical protein